MHCMSVCVWMGEFDQGPRTLKGQGPHLLPHSCKWAVTPAGSSDHTSNLRWHLPSSQIKAGRKHETTGLLNHCSQSQRAASRSDTGSCSSSAVSLGWPQPDHVPSASVQTQMKRNQCHCETDPRIITLLLKCGSERIITLNPLSRDFLTSHFILKRI